MSLRFDFAPFLARKGARRMVERVFQHLASGVGHLLTCVGVHARPNTQGFYTFTTPTSPSISTSAPNGLESFWNCCRTFAAHP